MRTILVTGGAKRIGKSITEQLGYGNNRVLIHYNNSDQDAKKLQNDLISRTKSSNQLMISTCSFSPCSFSRCTIPTSK